MRRSPVQGQLASAHWRVTAGGDPGGVRLDSEYRLTDLAAGGLLVATVDAEVPLRRRRGHPGPGHGPQRAAGGVAHVSATYRLDRPTHVQDRRRRWTGGPTRWAAPWAGRPRAGAYVQGRPGRRPRPQAGPRVGHGRRGRAAAPDRGRPEPAPDCWPTPSCRPRSAAARWTWTTSRAGCSTARSRGRARSTWTSRSRRPAGSSGRRWTPRPCSPSPATRPWPTWAGSSPARSRSPPAATPARWSRCGSTRTSRPRAGHFRSVMLGDPAHPLIR